MGGLIPSHIVFNGAVGGLTDDNAMKAKVGDRCLFVHSQANRDTRPHIIGSYGDFVWEAGNIHDASARDLGATGHILVEGDWNDDLMGQAKPIKLT